MEHMIIVDTGGGLHFAPLSYADFFIELMHGGVVRPCWTREISWHRKLECYGNLAYVVSYPTYKRVWGLRFLYYKVKSLPLRQAQVLNRKPPFYRSGFVSRTRGLHWNSKRRN